MYLLLFNKVKQKFSTGSSKFPWQSSTKNYNREYYNLPWMEKVPPPSSKPGSRYQFIPVPPSIEKHPENKYLAQCHNEHLKSTE